MDLFDLNLFRMSPKEASQTDPMQRLMLQTAYEALESAGYGADSTVNVGTYYGQGGDDYRQVNSGQDVDINYITGGIRAFGPGRVSHHFGWKGPSMTVDTACSASAVAIHQACSALKMGECDMALAGGANLLTCSDMFAGLSRASFLSQTGSCKTWDESADGYCRADAVATIVLKRVDNALKDGDNILGVIRSIATNHAADAVSITQPHADTQATLFQRVLESAGLTSDDIDHVEMHGTGTQAGDIAETSSVASLVEKPRPHPLYLGAVKANVGHSEAASGITSLIKSVLLIRHGIIPRHVGIKTKINSKLPPLGELNIRINMENVPFKPCNKDGIRRILINNFNATGGSTAMLLEEYVPKSKVGCDPRDAHIMAISAASQTSLHRGIEQLISHLESSEVKIPDLSYTLTARRMHHNYRFAFVASTKDDVLLKLRSKCNAKRGSMSSAAFVFTGQASQYAGMGHQLYSTSRIFQDSILASESICQSLGLPSFIDQIKDPKVEMKSYGPAQSQLALLALELALASLLESWGIIPSMVMGHSLGEYTALCVSQVLSHTDALYLVGKRALLLESKCSFDYGMIAVKSSASSVKHMLPQTCEIACINGPDMTIVSGPVLDIKRLNEILKNQRTKATILGVSHAFHSAQMDALLPEYGEILRGIDFGKPQIPVLSTLLGKVVEEQGVFNAQYMIRQTREKVDFHGSLQTPQVRGWEFFWIEVGPNPVCTTMIASSLGTEAKVAAIMDSKKTNWVSIGNFLSEFYAAGGNPLWSRYHAEYRHALSLIEIPTYAFDLTSHFIPYTGDWQIKKNQTVQDYREDIQSGTLHRLESDEFAVQCRKMDFISLFGQEETRRVIKACPVKDVPVFPSSLLAAMALAAASKFQEEATDLSLELPKPLKYLTDSYPSIKLTACQSDDHIDMFFASNEDQIADGRVTFGSSEERAAEVRESAYLSQTRIDMPIKSVPSTFIKAKYNECFQSLEEVVFDSNLGAATAKVKLQESQGPYACNPRWLDGLFHLSSLALRHTDDMTWIPHRWRSMRLAKPLTSGQTYHYFFRANSCNDQNSSGSLQLLEGNSLILSFSDIEFRSASHNCSLPTVEKSLESGLIDSAARTPNAHPMNYSTAGLSAKSEGEEDKSNSTREHEVDFLHIVVLIAAELGVEPTSISDDTLLDELGVDSLIQISIVGRLSEYVGKTLPKALLAEHNQVRALRLFFENMSFCGDV